MALKVIWPRRLNNLKIYTPKMFRSAVVGGSGISRRSAAALPLPNYWDGLDLAKIIEALAEGCKFGVIG